MALCRIKTIEQLQYESPRELGKRNLCRFVLVFDREGYSPVFFKEMWQSHRIVCITYHKFPKLNPDGLVLSLQGKLNRQQCLFAAHTIRLETELDEVPKWESRKRELKGHLESLEQELERAKQQRKETPHHLKWEELPEPSKFERLSPSRKHLTDTVKMIANRAETSMMQIVRESLAGKGDSRSVVRDLLRTPADLSLDLE